jgi:hypothetical protein
MTQSPFLYRILLFSVGVVLIGSWTVSTQEDNPCSPDLDTVLETLTRAQLAFDEGNVEAGLETLVEAQTSLSTIEEACRSTLGGVGENLAENSSDSLLARFPEIDNEDLQTWHEDGVFHINSETTERQFIELPEISAADFTLEFSVQVQPGFVAGAEYGIAFRGAEGFERDFYHWRISTNGRIIAYANTIHGPRGAMQGYEPQANAVDWLDTPAYERTMNAVNHFALTCEGDTCQYSINEELVLQTRDPRLVSGGFALVTAGVLHITVEDFTLTHLKS